MIKLSLFTSFILLFTGCSYSNSALEYANQGTKRVQSGYTAKVEITDKLLEYLKEANKDCGVKVEVINNIPITKVKECVNLENALRVVDNVEIIKPEKLENMSDGIGNFLLKSSSVIVPLAGIYYNTRLQEKTLDYNYKTNVNNNAYQQELWKNYTSTYKNESVQIVEPNVQVIEPTIVTQESVQVVESTNNIETNNNTNSILAPIGTFEKVE